MMKPRKQTNKVIFHHTLSSPETTVDDIREWHIARGWEDIGYHIVIRGSGEVQHGRAGRMIGAHAFGRNRDSIGVALCGDFFQYEPTKAQLDSAQAVYHGMCRAVGKMLKIEFHRPWWFANACPGVMLDRKDFLEVVYRGCPYDYR